MSESSFRSRFVVGLLALFSVVTAGCLWYALLFSGGLQRVRAVDTSSSMTGGDAEAGYRMIVTVGCGACHTIPGIPGAYGKVGPSLAQFKDRAFIAGVLENSKENVAKWIHDPVSIDPYTAMPKLGLTLNEARDIAAYLYAPSKFVWQPTR
jgi:cytochrome c